jgi:signal transduction histidine kinase/HD-GYP domain-containing protein (c-di-GMP phosphodiesterase class II)
MSPRRKKQGPSTGELRLRTELDRLRREITKLKKGEDLLPTDAPMVAAPRSSESEKTRLASRVAELEQSQSRLSKLYFTQLDENRRHSSRLREILRSVSEINADLDLEGLLERVAGAIQSCVGFRIVFIRLREPGGDRLRAAAYSGLGQVARQALDSCEVRIEDLRAWLRDEFKVGRSYFISHKHPFSRELPAGYVADLGRRKEWEWHAEDILLTPLVDSRGELLGYVSVDDPADRLVPSQETIELLEVVASHAAVAIENAQRIRRAMAGTPELEAAGDSPREMDRLKREFVSTISHELRTPLTVIQAFTDTVLHAGIDQVPHDRLHEFVNVVDEESRRLSRLIESVLDIGRFDAGAFQAQRRPTDLMEIVDESLWMLSRMAQARQVDLKVARELDDTGLDADRDQIRQLVLHLASNAIKFTPPGGRVFLRVAGNEDSVAFDVEDTGIGIPEEALEKIFDRFYQVDSSLVRRYGGGGLGLAICKSIVEWHRGTITVRSRPGTGSTFTVVLPRRIGPRVSVRPSCALPPAAQDVLKLAVEVVSEVMDAGVVSLMALQDDGTLVIEAAMGLEPAVLREALIRPGVGVAGWVAQNCRPLCVSGREAAEVEGSGRERYRTGTFLSVPLQHGDHFLGVLNVTDPVSRRPFQIGDCHLVLELAEAIAHAWRYARANAEGRSGLAGAFGRVLEHVRLARARAPERVQLARALAEQLALPPSRVALIGFAAAVHDVGMTLVGREILDGDAPLTPEQRDRMRRHVELGADVLENLENMGAETFGRLETMRAVREIVLSHHEWWDGSGYPRGLKGEEIPIGSRVLAVVDAFESISLGRAYRPARSRAEAVGEIRSLRGKQFDPDVVDAVGRLLPRLHDGESALSEITVGSD